MEIKYQNLRVLGPAVLKVKIPDVILKKLNEYIDRDIMFEKTFITPLSFILESRGWDVEKKASWEAFFG